jgi:ABC-type multidrug transport system ATPase subunit
MEYSTGMRQRLAVARALLTDPDLLLLDEVGQGLDPAFNTFLLELLATRTRERGTGVIFATHHLEELQDRADRVLALVKGRVVYLGATAGFDPSVLEAGTPDGATP